MITNMSLKNFKSFKELSTLQIKPLTVLCGANSSGKTTLLKSLLTLKQSYESSLTYDALILNGEYANNGFFEDVVFQGTADTFTLSHTFFIKNPFYLGRRIKKKTANLQTYKALRKIFLDTNEYPDSFEIKTETTFSSKSEGALGRSSIIHKYILDISVNMGEKITTSRVSMERQDMRNFSLEWENIPDAQHNFVSGKAKQCVAYFYGLQLGNIYIYSENLPKGIVITNILPNIYTLCKLAADQYQSISFLGPLRLAPARAYMYTNEALSIGTMGEYTPFILAQNRDKKLHVVLPQFHDELIFKSHYVTLLEATQMWLDYMNIDCINITQQSEIVKLKIGNSNIVDVGFGISQVLPIIVEGLSILSEQTLILEQPEIHLHPNMQMCLADFLISLIKSGKQVIVETHSDHIINRLIRRIMEDNGEFLLKNSVIYYVEKPKENSQITQISVDKIHGIAQCPPDFFSQYSSEVDMIVRTGFENIRKEQFNNAPN